MKLLRNAGTGRLPMPLFRNLGVAARLFVVAAPLAFVPAQSVVAQARPSIAGQSADDFYRARNDAPLWLAPAAGDAANQLIALLASASLDGLDPNRYHVAALKSQMLSARADRPKDKLKVDRALSQAFVAYLDDVVPDPGVGVTYVDPQLKPTPPSPRAALLLASAAPSLSGYIRTIGWMNPIYAGLRTALANHAYATDAQRDTIALNLKRARALPAGKQRYIIVNAAQQRLYMYDGGKQVDSMVVVVGKPKWQTPMLTAYVRFAALNPYWYVPPDLAGEDVGQFVVKQGLPYLDKMGYQVVSDWSRDPTIVDPATIDWKGVVSGKVEVMIRQKPGPQNFMGRMKFMFPNEFGVYLHDNPRRELFLKSERYFSGGCVRLEDAARLGRWLFGRDLEWQGAAVEQQVMLPRPVPVYITYLTAMPVESSIAFFEDTYARDAKQLAAGGGKVANSGAGTEAGAAR